MIIPFIIGLVVLLASSTEITDNYIAEFKQGIAELKKFVTETTPIVENYNSELYNETEALSEAETYDFIIIGAGASGSVVANRLSEVPEWKILLLEAGGHETPYTQIPQLATLLPFSPYDWQYLTTHQNHSCLGMLNNQCALSAGKVLGGGTAINLMMYTRGNAKDYDLWADQGNDGWCYNDVLPYFKKLEDAHIENFDHKYHNHGGPVHIEHPPYRTHDSEDIIQAGEAIGLKRVDYNGKEQLGISVIQTNTKNGKRQSTAQAYLKPVKHRSNLKIQTLSHVVKILIGEHTKRAQGVEYLHNGKLFVAKADKEVVLSAGAINTAQLLMLSGIGPKKHLTDVGIPIIKDLAVGQNLKDHFGFLGLNYIYNTTNSEPDKDYDATVDYLKNGKGPLTSNGVQAIAFIQTDIAKELNYPDIELFFHKTITSNAPNLNPLHLKHETSKSLWKNIDIKKVLNVGVMLAHPKSIGTVHLADKDPLHPPFINTNQFTDPSGEDIATLLAGTKKAIKLLSMAPISKQAEINKNRIAGCENFIFGSDEYWTCGIQHFSTGLRHVTGTAKMGPQSDKKAVVDNQLKVHGIAKLRVIDASIIPITITGHTMAAAIMIGEKGADLIKADWK